MTKLSHRYGVGSAIFFVLAFVRVLSRDIVSAHTSYCLYSLWVGEGISFVKILNKVLFCFLLLLSYDCFQAQQFPDRFIFSTAGRDLKNLTLGTPASQNRKVTFTMGEPIIGLFSLSGKRLSVGFIQPDGIFPIAPPSPVQITLNDPFQISPNPATNYTVIKAPELWEGKVTVQLMDIQGKLVKTQTMESLVLEFSLDHQITPGSYFLNFYKEDGSFLQQSKLIKMNKL